MKGFASDNISGVHPVILRAMADANTGHVHPYGDDPFTRCAVDMLKEQFGRDSDVFFVFNGTAANVLSLAAMTRSFNSVLCAETSHINVDECGAPEKFTGCKLVALPSSRGKLTVDMLESQLEHLGFEHHSQPFVISITQPTELGEVYSCEEVTAITRFAKDNNLLVHMDGARLANAAAFLGSGLKAMTRDLGIDVLSFGGTKNGAMFGEAVIFFNTALASTFRYIRKQGMQLGSKMRFIAAQFTALLTDDLWLANARHANAMAHLLHDRIKDLPGVCIVGRVETNAVFARIPMPMVEHLQKEVFFYTWDRSASEVRFMTSFDTTEEDVERFAGLIAGASKDYA